MTENEKTESRFHDGVPTVPVSVAPSFSSLQQRVQRRRRARRLVRTSCSLGCLALLGFLLMPKSVPSPGLQQLTEQKTPEANQSVIATDQPKDSQRIDVASETDPGFRLFARVVQPVPVFHRLPDSEDLYHIGWVGDEAVLPVDINQFPAEQRQTFESVLNENTAAQWINL